MSAQSSLRSVFDQISMVHVIVVTLSLMMTLGAFLFSQYQIQSRIHARFELGRDRALDLIVDRMGKYEDALWAGVSAVESHGGDMSLEEWRIFAHTLRIEQKYPGINGIGIIHYLTPDAVPAYLEQRQAERPDFRIYPAHEAEILMPISFIVPEDANAAAVGLDIAHEVNRRSAALASRDTGQSQITGPIVLVQDEGNTPGFLFYAPYYEGGPRPDRAERREAMLGIVYAPFVVRKLMAGLLAKELRQVRFSIRDAEQVIYDEHAAEDGLTDPDPMFSETVRLDLYGRVWTLDIRTNFAFRHSNTFAQPTVILIGGLLIEGLIIALIIMLSRANNRATAYADRVTAVLREEKNKLAAANTRLEAINAELEQFSYITSHDLRTPIRGIGGLTEIIKEDLEDYMAAPGANPDVKRNLDHILERVDRMNALIRGILEFSMIGQRPPGEEALDLPQAIASLRADLSLRQEQLRLAGPVTRIAFDGQMFRRVLENLVGNAIRHHDTPEQAAIRVTVEQHGDHYEVSVQDNGPGIAPRYHSKIFGVFQTLRAGSAPESTGIGLAIVKKAVARHGCSATVHSTPGNGATFRFDWPTGAASTTDGSERTAQHAD